MTAYHTLIARINAEPEFKASYGATVSTHWTESDANNDGKLDQTSFLPSLPSVKLLKWASMASTGLPSGRAARIFGSASMLSVRAMAPSFRIGSGLWDRGSPSTSRCSTSDLLTNATLFDQG